MKDRIERAENRLKLLLNKPIDKRGRAFFIEKPVRGRRFIITDIHGCYQSFVKLLDKIDLKKADQLFLLGDMIDRGPYSLMVVEKVCQLLDRGYQVYPLRGNHEQLFLNMNRENHHKTISFAHRQFAGHLLKPSGELLPAVDHFFAQLPIYYETDSAFLVHAGFNTRQKSPFEAWKDMMWIRSFRYDEKKLKGKRIFHGHVPVEYHLITKALAEGHKAIGLDNGCVRAEVEGFGKLVCLDMDTLELVVQKNVDLLPG